MVQQVRSSCKWCIKYAAVANGAASTQQLQMVQQVRSSCKWCSKYVAVANGAASTQQLQMK
jgi:hypothetical protein